MSYRGEKEIKKNRSKNIDKWNKHVGSPVGSPYCAAFVYYCWDSAGVKYNTRRSGLARHLVSKKNTFTAWDVIMGRERVQLGDAGIYQKGSTMFGHAFLVTKDWDGVNGRTIEANTSSGIRGSQSDGDGVYERNRRIEVYSYFRIKWFTRF